MRVPPLIEAMLKREFYPHAPKEVQMVQTHISWVFLADELVYKVKKPVNYGFLDFSTLEKRRFYCNREVELNRRLSGDIYLGVVPIVLDDGVWRLGDDQEMEVASEYAVLMKRIPDRSLLQNLIRKGKVPPNAMEMVAKVVAGFHSEAERSPEIAAFGTPERFRVNTDENFSQTEEYIGVSISREAYSLIKEKTEEFYASQGTLMERRAREGRVVDCHGDLHSQHICLLDEEVVIFDCIEFNERFRYGDVASEVAFLAMDLEFLMQHQLAAQFVDHYVEFSGDEELREMLPFYLCYRAYVRGKVESFRIHDETAPFEERMNALLRAQRFFFLAEKYAREM